MQRENISDIIETYLKTILAQEAAVEIGERKLHGALIVFLRKLIMLSKRVLHRHVGTLLKVSVAAVATFGS